MPLKSKAQRRTFAQLLVEGKITPETFEEWNRMTQPSRIGATLLTAVAIGHLTRVVMGIQVTIADNAVPMWVSVVAAIVAGGVALMLWRDRR